MGCSKEALRIVLWMSWVIQWLFNMIFVTITLISFTQLWEASSVYLPAQGSSIYSERTWRAPMASCILSAMLVIGYDVFSCVTLIKKSINRAGPGFGFGFIVAFCFCLAFFLLLCGLILDSFRPKVKTLADYDWTRNGTVTTGYKWETYDTQVFIGAEVLALINFVVLLIFAVILVVLQAGVSEQLGMNSPQYAALEAPPMLGAADGYMDGIEGGQQYDDRYAPEENAGLRDAGAAPLNQQYAQQGSFNNSQSAGYYASGHPGYGATAAAAPAAGGGVAYYGQNAYGSSDPYGGYGDGSTAAHYQEPAAAPAPAVPAAAGFGSSLLGGQVLGTSPTPAQPQQTYTATPTGYSYQQF